MGWFTSKKRDFLKAAKKGDLAVVRASLANSADPNTKTLMGDDTALIIAAEHGHLEVVRELLAAGADIHARNVLGQDALVRAACKGNAAMATELIQAGADVNSRNNKGENAFIAMLTAPDFVEPEPGQAEVVRTLVASGLDLAARDNLGGFSLWVAARYRCADFVRILLEAGANPNDTHEGMTPLMVASAVGDGGTVRALIAGNADANATFPDTGATVLMFAAGFAHGKLSKLMSTGGDTPERVDAVRALLEGGADVNARLEDGTTALMAAAEMGRTQVVKALIEGGADLDAATSGVGKVIEYGGGVTKEEHRGCTALMLAAVEGHKDAAVALIEAGANVDLTTSAGATAQKLAQVTFHVITSVAIEEAIEKQKKQASTGIPTQSGG